MHKRLVDLEKDLEMTKAATEMSKEIMKNMKPMIGMEFTEIPNGTSSVLVTSF